MAGVVNFFSSAFLAQPLTLTPGPGGWGGSGRRGGSVLDLSVIMECYFLRLLSMSALGSGSHSLILTPGDHVTRGRSAY